ncbi:MAG: hypothetical protein NWR72_17980 [Bacteroidia bacterium]|nr:hypothetical protein [Bacteroidia bacterium]
MKRISIVFLSSLMVMLIVACQTNSITPDQGNLLPLPRQATERADNPSSPEKVALL